ncbi:MAG: ABC transporter permease, partial [bacterium]|nr:ABC transporter permease [bacterium]
LGAAGWGGAHALTPGHGKAIVGAYLVGARSTPWQAVYLGLTVTATHTLGVFTLGLITLFASKYLVAEDLYPWLGAVSGFMVLAIGAFLLVKRWKDWRSVTNAHEHQLNNYGHEHNHDHDHSHDHIHDHAHDDDLHHDHHDHDHDHGHTHLPPGADGASITWRSLLGLGISGGLLPCPAALVLLLAAVSLQRTGLGLALVIAFSLGLAGVLTAVGLLFVKGGQLINRVPRATAMARFLPVLSSLAIAVIGAVVTAQSMSKISF